MTDQLGIAIASFLLLGILLILRTKKHESREKSPPPREELPSNNRE